MGARKEMRTEKKTCLLALETHANDKDASIHAVEGPHGIYSPREQTIERVLWAKIFGLSTRNLLLFFAGNIHIF